MPTRIFAITAPSEIVTLDDQGRGQISFTASNTGPKSMAGRAKLVPLGSTKEPWLSLEGEQERNFAKGEAQQFTVKIAPPRGTPAGKYSFRLNIISVDNPDDEFTEGPSVSFEVKQLAPAAPPPRRFPWWIVAVAGVVVLGAGIITWLLLPQKVAVPDLVGMPYEDAIKSLEGAKLKLTTKDMKVTGKQKPGIVLEQSPQAKGSVPIGSGVSLVVEVPPETIPVQNVVGQPLNQAEDLLKGLASEVGGKRFTGKFPPGVVIEQSPTTGAIVPPGTKVTLILETDTIVVQNVVGQPLNQAKDLLKGLASEVGGKRLTGKFPPNAVIEQSPVGGVTVPPGTKVILVVEADWVQVPNLRGKPVGQALDELRSLQLVPQYRDGDFAGKLAVLLPVVWQSPEAGVRVAPGTTVTVNAVQ